MADKTQIIMDRDAGMTLKQIAEKHHVSKQYVSRVVGCVEFKEITEKQCIYPNLRKWMNENEIDKRELLFRMYLVPGGATSQKLNRILKGQAAPTKDWIDAMLEATGMTYERLFKEA